MGLSLIHIYWLGDEHAKDDANYGWGAGFALEAEMYPDTPHQPLFPQGIVAVSSPHLVLVLCQGAGTSTLLANALREGAAAKGIDLVSQSGAYGSHYETMDQYNVIVLAPQARMYYCLLYTSRCV